MVSPGTVLASMQIPVRELQAMIFQKYPQGDEIIERTLLRLWVSLAPIAEIARKDDRKDVEALPRQLAEIYKWWTILAGRRGVDLDDALWSKYPGVCPWCLESAYCKCGPEHPVVKCREEWLILARVETEHRPIFLSDHQALHRRLYGVACGRSMPFQLMNHLVEEGGEVTEEFLKDGGESLQHELADIGAWLFTIANRFDYDLTTIVKNYCI